MSLETLQNLTDIPQHVFYDGQRHEIPPHEARTFEESVAQTFLNERPQFVRRFEGKKNYVVQGKRTVWIANCTGNPFAPKKIMRTVIQKGKETQIEEDNPILKPRVIKETINTGQTYTGQVDTNERNNLNHPPQKFEILPYERVPVPYDVAEIFLGRDGFREQELQGQVRACPPEYPFEPNESWPLDDVRLYAMLLDKVDLHCDPMRKGTPPEKKLPNNSEREREKTKLLHKIFFRLIDGRYSPPKQEEFLAAKAEIEAAKVVEESSVADTGGGQEEAEEKATNPGVVEAGIAEMEAAVANAASTENTRTSGRGGRKRR